MGIVKGLVYSDEYYEMACDLLRKTVLDNPYIPHVPTPQQAVFLTLPHKDAFYGGQLGGGKSDALLMGALQFVGDPNSHSLLLRRSFADLALPGALMDRAHQWLSNAKCAWDDREKKYTFPSGATISFGYMETERDKYRYASAEFTYIAMDEATQFTPTQLTYMFSRLRKPVGAGIPCRFRTASNPGNVGHDFMRHRYVDPGDPERPFVPAALKDNPHLDQVDYQDTLKNLDKVTYRQLAEGVWDDPTPEGAYYAKILDDMALEGRLSNVPHDSSLPVDTWWDLGIAAGRDSMVIWFTQSDGLAVRVIEVYGNSGEGLPFYAKLLNQKPYTYRNHFAPHDIKVRELGSGKSRQEVAYSLGIRFQVVPDIGVDNGINAVRQILPRCHFDAAKCAVGLRALRNYHKEWDDRGQCWKTSPVKDWTNDYADAFRMFAVGYQDKKIGHKKPPVITDYDHFGENNVRAFR